MKLKQMQQRCQELEARIAELEAEISACERELANFVNAEATMRVSTLAEQHRAELTTLLAEWEELSQAVASQA
jgi:ATP-binding cassette subfamily F protein 3